MIHSNLCGYRLNDIGERISWQDIRSFLYNLSPDSALVKEVNPDFSLWSSNFKTNAILADICDILIGISTKLSVLITKKNQNQPKPYPRPDSLFLKENSKKQQIGKDGLPPEELERWFTERRKKRNGRK